MSARVLVSGVFDDPRSSHLRFLQEASLLGPVTVSLWPDDLAARTLGAKPRLGLEERRYYLESIRYVSAVVAAPEELDPDSLPSTWKDAAGGERSLWAACSAEVSRFEAPNAKKREWCRANGIELVEIDKASIAGFPAPAAPFDGPPAGGRKRVVVTGCYDWLHTGHIRFFEEASAYGELNVVIGSDSNVRLLKGTGHPLFPEAERRYVVSSFRSVERCLVSTGSGWLDAEPEIRAMSADRYVVNEDGDKSEKRRFCQERGIEYVVLARTPKEGLPRRSSTDLRGY